MKYKRQCYYCDDDGFVPVILRRGRRRRWSKNYLPRIGATAKMQPCPYCNNGTARHYSVKWSLTR
jgi:hypothetical protein